MRITILLVISQFIASVNGAFASTPQQHLIISDTNRINKITLSKYNDFPSSLVAQTLIDTIKPIARIRDTVYIQIINDVAVLNVSQIDLGSTDDVAIDTMFVTPNTFTCNSIGFFPVVFTVKDKSGNTTTANSVVYVNSPFFINDLPDTLDECSPITITWREGCSNWNVNLSLLQITPFVTFATFSQNSPNVPRTRSWQIPPNVPEGLYQLYIEESNKVSWSYGKVFYIRNTPPIVRTKNITLSLDAQGNAAINPSQIDNGSSDICGIASMTVSPDTLHCNNVGINTVMLTVTDLNGNVRTATATVTLVDNIKPTIIPPPNVTVFTDQGASTASNVALGTPTTSDNCTIVSTVNDAPLIYPIGVTTVTWTVTDIYLNKSTATQTVTVTDNQKTTIVLALPVIEANLDETVNIPLTLVSSSRIDTLSPPPFKARIRYNKTILLPIDKSLPVTFDGNDAVMEISGSIAQSSQILAAPAFKVLMGNADKTNLLIDTFILAKNNNLSLTKNNGSLLVKDVCRAGDSARLFKTVAAAALVAIRPNPIEANAAIDFIISESGCTSLTLTNLEGLPIRTIWQDEIKEGEYSIQFSCDGLSGGQYFLQLRTPNQIFTSKLIIRK